MICILVNQVSPSSKLSTVEWRQQAFSILRRLLSIKTLSTQLLVPDSTSGLVSEPVSAESLTARNVQCDIDDCMFLSLRRLEKIKWR